MGQPYPARCAEGPASRAEGNTRAQKYETVKLYLIGEEITKHSPSDGEPLTGSQVREGIAVQGSHSFARLSGAGTAIPISRPAGQRNAQNEGVGVWFAECTMGGGKPIYGPNQRLTQMDRRPVETPPSMQPQGTHVTAYPIHASTPPNHKMAGGRGLGISPGSSMRASRRYRDPNPNHIRTMATRLAACAAMGYLRSLSRYLDLYPILFYGVSLTVSQ